MTKTLREKYEEAKGGQAFEEDTSIVHQSKGGEDSQARLVELLELSLQLAKDGRIVGVALVTLEPRNLTKPEGITGWINPIGRHEDMHDAIHLLMNEYHKANGYNEGPRVTFVNLSDIMSDGHGGGQQDTPDHCDEPKKH